MENENEENSLVAYTVDEALNAITKREEERDKKYINKELDEQPRTYVFTGIIQFGKMVFKKKVDGKEVDDPKDIWHFEVAENREFSTSNFTLAKEIVSALKDKKYKITLAHRSQKGKDDKFHDTIALLHAE